MLARKEEFFIGVDGGGTKTCAVVVNKDGHIFGEGRAGAANPITVGIPTASQAINQAINCALRQANIFPAQVANAYLGIAGVEHVDIHEKFNQSLQGILPLHSFQLGTDAFIALAGATDLRPGVVIISGTGSIALGRNSRGEEARAGGWGPTIGDEGSGYYIARRGLTAVAKAYDGRGSETLITDLLRKRANVRTPADLQRIIYFPFANNSDIAAYCEIVVEAGRAGDPIAQDILCAAGRELGVAVAAVIKRLNMESETFPIAYVGGTFQAGNLLIASMSDVIKQTALKAQLQKPRYSPALGAAKLAISSGSLRKSA
jgi:N-acetylglucosamine kinase-like BadF-type ATPase